MQSRIYEKSIGLFQMSFIFIILIGSGIYLGIKYIKLPSFISGVIGYALGFFGAILLIWIIQKVIYKR